MTVVLAKSAMLKIMTGVADRTPMLSPTLQFDVTPEQQQLLHAYQAQAASLKVTSEEFDGWLERVDELAGIEVSQLTALHGQLIATGMLKFEISGRSVGLKYQLSQQGKKALEVKAVCPDNKDISDDVQQESVVAAADDDENDETTPASGEITDSEVAMEEATATDAGTVDDAEICESEICESEICTSEASDTEASDTEGDERETVQPTTSEPKNEDELANDSKIVTQQEPEVLEPTPDAQKASDVGSVQNSLISEAA